MQLVINAAKVVATLLQQLQQLLLYFQLLQKLPCLDKNERCILTLSDCNSGTFSKTLSIFAQNVDKRLIFCSSTQCVVICICHIHCCNSCCRNSFLNICSNCFCNSCRNSSISCCNCCCRCSCSCSSYNSKCCCI